MSGSSIAPYFPFARVKITGQSVSANAELAWIEVRPDERFKPLCHRCGQPVNRMHQWRSRPVRHLNFGSARVWLHLHYRRVVCRACSGVFLEDLDLVAPCQRVTKRLARSIHDLCRVMTVQDVARHFGLDWKTVKRIDKTFLEEEYGQPDYDGVTLLAVDEIAVRKGHEYMTVVIDYDTGRVLWMGQGRTQDTLLSFFATMTEEQKRGLKAVAMDMWQAYITAVEQAVPHVKIVFDLFHVVSKFGKVIDHVRNSEYAKASQQDRAVFKGAKYLLLKNRANITKPKDRQHLARLMALNETICAVRILRDELATLWDYRDRPTAAEALDAWCAMAESTRQRHVIKFAESLQAHREGILNHCDYPIHTGVLEGTNNTIKVIKRKAYGFRDDRYFILKVKQAFDLEDST
jgi:transposase